MTAAAAAKKSPAVHAAGYSLARAIARGAVRLTPKAHARGPQILSATAPAQSAMEGVIFADVHLQSLGRDNLLQGFGSRLSISHSEAFSGLPED